MKHPKVAISGSRTFTDISLIERVVDRLIERRAFILVPCGGDARDRRCTDGVDAFVHQYVEYRADDVYDYDVVYADWRTYGKRAGFLRNEDLIYQASELIAILAPGPATPGTSHTLLLATRKGIPIHTFHEGKWTSLDRL